ncbi:MAG TPA: M13-type metalloendopeptidase [Steroidobacteraceae bacterium]|nr:M13-type metalloendopeptidase [Steroidobacteraceae bacterium]
MKKLIIPVVVLAACAACSPKQAAGPAPTAAAQPAPLGSGIELQYIDDSVRPQDDFYQHVNGKWLATFQIPPDKVSYDPWDKLIDDAQQHSRDIIEGLQKHADPAEPEQQKLADLYTSFMDEAAVEKLGLAPLAKEFAAIDALKDKQQIAGQIAHFNRIGVAAPFSEYVHQDAKDATRYVFELHQDGLGLPDRDYYLQNDPKLKQARDQYLQHVRKMLQLAGDKDAAGEARQILALETALAKLQWTKVANRDPVKTYNKVELDKLPKLAPGIDWPAYLSAAGVAGATDYLVIKQPSYFTGLSAVLASTPLPVWKTYFRWHLLSGMAPYLPKAYVDENFAFYGTALSDVPQIRPRWKRGVSLVENEMGEALGKIYVARYFPPQSKARMDQLVKNLLAAYRADIDKLDWMSAETKQKAQEKLARFTPKIGYPSKWRDYSALQTAHDDLMGNVMRANEFEYDRNLKKLGQPIDRTEWFMTPQTVNAYYNPEMNEVVFPAAVLQPPMFNPAADDAVNYGGIGAVIGHEISHGLDDRGSQYDGNGNLLGTPGWFTKDDYKRFREKTKALVAQYSAREPVPGFHVNGELTLGENIADNSGLAIAYKAYQISLGGKPAPVLDGLTGDQRFYMGYSHIWMQKIRTNEAILELKTDPHSPEPLRGQLPLMNQPAFYEAFGVKPGDKMYLPPEKRVSLW